ncbi:MAG: DUF3185 family protein [Bradymonadaceae bacterium]|nr:DUF3185 family protein [Lujinxingiaceae bacterium]
MSVAKIAGLVLLVVGLALLFFGWQATESISEGVRETLTGRYSDETMWFLIGGGAAAVAGLALLLFKK